MVSLTDADIDEIVVSDFDTRIRRQVDTEAGESPLLKELMRSCRDLSTVANQISTGSQFSVATSLPGVSEAASSANRTICDAMARLLKFSTGGEVYAADIKDWSFIEDGLDSIFSRIDEALASDSQASKRRKVEGAPGPQKLVSDKPQREWMDLIDNYRPFFVPVIREKINAIEALDPLLEQYHSEQSSKWIASLGWKDFGNVYEAEIQACLRRVIQEVNARDSLDEVCGYEDLSSTDLIFVESEEQLDTMIEEILCAREVAIDLEHHDLHSFRGFTCLIQLSTRTKDYIVDPFPLFRSLHKLNKFTTNRDVKKTLHGADMDVQWLQRDFGVYIVNMFDTGQAARVLGLAGGYGLANLLDSFCKVKTNKRFQMSDWRTRPLPRDMLEYARMDTHYLLYIRDKLEALILSLGGQGLVSAYGKKMMAQVIEKSFGVSSKVYRDASSDCETDKDVFQFCMKSSAVKVGQLRNNPKGIGVLKAVLGWRERKAKILDESKNYVLSNSICLRLANAIPSTVPQILRCVVQETSLMFPSMRIGSEEADEILSEISTVLLSEPSKIDKEMVIPDQEHDRRPLSGRKSSGGASVVRAGEDRFGTLKVEQRIESSGNMDLEPEKWNINEDSSSKLLRFFRSSSVVEVSETHQKIAEEISMQFTSCPPILESEHLAWKNKTANESLANDVEMAAVPFAVNQEFVSFTGQKSKQVIETEINKDTAIPMTVKEQRKLAPKETITHAKKSKNKNKLSAAEKALEFVEQELSLSSSSKHKHTRR